MKQFFTDNREKLFNEMSVGDIAVIYSGTAPNSTADSFYKFRVNKNFYYLTGLKREGFTLVMTKSSEDETKSTLFIKKPNYDIEKWVGRFLDKDACTEISGIDTVQYLDEFDTWFNRLANSTKFGRVWLDLFKLSINASKTESDLLALRVREIYPYLTIKNSHELLSNQRLIKSDYELECIAKATELTQKGLEAILKTLKPGDFEYVPAAEFQYQIMRNGADRNSFETIAASGDNAVILHYEENEAEMKDGDLILFDLGAQKDEYAADISRTFPINGQFSDRQKVIYNIVLGAQETVIASMKPGITITECNKICSDYLAERLIEIGLIEDKKGLGKYYYHGVSHFLGLDVHDLGSREVTFEPGMVLTVEPGLYIAEESIGIRIEDNVVITETGARNLSTNIMKSVEDIESYMKG